MPAFSQFPIPFWIAVFMAAGTGYWFWQQRHTGYGIPGLAVLGTVAVWYFGDALYNDYAKMVLTFGTDVLAAAWWQVVLFIGGFAFFLPRVHLALNRRVASQGSEVLRFAAGRDIEHPSFQRVIDRFLSSLILAWIPLMILALIRTDFDFIGLFFPWLGHKAEPWGRDRIGGGFDAILSLSAYVQVFMTASFGIIAAVSRNPRTKVIALCICAITMPFFLLDRTRNTMLSTVLPGVLAWVFLGLRGNFVMRFALLAVAFFALEGWLSFVIKSRGEGKNVAAFFAESKEKEGGANLPQVAAPESDEDDGKTKHDGLNMFEELAWITTFIEAGNYTPNYGRRYFAELVNPIPRALWPNKPLIAIDYAKARGFGGGTASAAGVVASISTGMIGQGVTNFGRFFGPFASALLMALWAALLARQDLGARGEPARLLLYGLGLVLTFNLGRDITLLVLYPFVFGWLLFWWWSRYVRKSPRKVFYPSGLNPVRTVKAPQSETREERQRRRRRLRPISFEDDPEEPLLEPVPEATPAKPPVPKPMTPPPGLSDEDGGVSR
jgi:hypothetical protein